MSYATKDFDYNLPKNLIAQEPIKPRDNSRLLVLRRTAPKALLALPCFAGGNANRALGAVIKHSHFYDIVDYVKKGDVLVLNNSKVFPARLIGKKKETGGKIEVFLTSPPTPLLNRRGEPRREKGGGNEFPSCLGGVGGGIDRRAELKGRGNEVWQCLLGGRGAKEGLEIKLGRGLECEVLKNNNDGTWEIKFNKRGKEMMEIVHKIGKMPLPPYIDRKSDFGNRISDKKDYQTVYADDNKIGSVAAPTAGFHFTPALIKKLKAKGAQFEYITLHVGLGTFSPVKVDDITKHKMHSELVEVKKDVIKRIIKAKKEKRRIIAIGTTSVRTLEGLVAEQLGKPLSQISNFKLPISTFIYPGYKFKVVDAMITNFHLPKSTLLMLVSALAGKLNIDKAYKIAVSKKYRFYSYGDAMFIY